MLADVVAPYVHELLLFALETVLLLAFQLVRRWKRQALQYYTVQTTATQREWLRLVGVEAFHYAERVFALHDGPAKLNEAVKYVLERAAVHGITVTYPEIRAVIEKAWSETGTTKKENI